MVGSHSPDGVLANAGPTAAKDQDGSVVRRVSSAAPGSFTSISSNCCVLIIRAWMYSCQQKHIPCLQLLEGLSGPRPEHCPLRYHQTRIQGVPVHAAERPMLMQLPHLQSFRAAPDRLTRRSRRLFSKVHPKPRTWSLFLEGRAGRQGSV